MKYTEHDVGILEDVVAQFYTDTFVHIFWTCSCNSYSPHLTCEGAHMTCIWSGSPGKSDNIYITKIF